MWLGFIVALAAGAQIFAPVSPFAIVAKPFEPPLGDFLFGTDSLGRDLMSGLVHGARTSLLIAIIATLAAVAFGTLVGALAGFYGGFVDDALMRVTEFFQTIPSFIFAIVLVAILAPSGISLVIAIATVSWPPIARVVRGEVLTIKSREFVQAAIVAGQRDIAILLGQVLPNTLSPLIVTGLPAGRQCHPDRICAVVPRARRAQSDELGLPDRRRPGLPARCLVAGYGARRRHPAHRAVNQPSRRGPQRRAQPEAQRPVSEPVLRIENLTVSLPSWADRPRAVDGVSLEVMRKEILCVVGESGSGKSVMCKSILRLLPEPHVRVSGGRIIYEGQDLLALPEDGIRSVRGGRIAMIFQEPMVALNPLMTVGRQADEIIEAHTTLRAAERRKRIVEVFGDVRLPDPGRLLSSYPHELSGGQRQRVMIAMALVLEPALIIADEPTTALDVTTQAQILKLLKELQARHGTAIMFITHDFGVVAEIADRVAVMRHGALVEHGQVGDVLMRPQHAYTRALIAAVPSLMPRHILRTGEATQPRSYLLTITDLKKSYAARGGAFSLTRERVRAVDGVSLDVLKGRSLALVGESGSGKSTLARCIVGLERPDGGAILLEGTDIAGLSRARMRPLSQGAADGVPGPVRLTQSALARRRHHRSGSHRQRHAAQDRAGGGARAAAPSRSRPQGNGTLSRTSSRAASASASASPGHWR